MFMNWLLDVRYGLRMLRRSPAFTVTAVLILGLGIGANTAIFTLINAAIWQQLPVRDPGRLVLFYDGVSTGTYSGTGYHNNFFSYPFWQYLHDHQTSFEELCAFRQGEDGVTLQLPGASGSGHREQTTAHLVSGNYFKVLGVPAAVGR
ncbi:MAG TPA: hypothetical protein VG672_19115, partial [Bryobacteraceae bacterium]|nr:hypothetical protein [Bryobacteraceae bacterium]